jgi:HEAT repeat protein
MPTFRPFWRLLRRRQYRVLAAPLAPLLMQLTHDEHWTLRSAAAHALAEIGPIDSEQIPQLIPLLDDRDTRISAARLLGKYGPAAQSALPKLRGLSHRSPTPHESQSGIGNNADKNEINATIARISNRPD